MRSSTIVICILLFAMMFLVVVPVQADDIPTVTIGSYKVNPSVLMPGSLGTITITVNNTASSASVTQETGELSSTTYTQVRTNDFNVNIQNVHLEGNGIVVLTQDFNRVGAIGPGQSIPLTFSIQAPDQSGLYYPEVWIDTLGGQSTKYPIPVNVDTAVGIQKQAVLILDSSINGSVNPGDVIPVTITISNTGQLLADDIILKIANVSTDIAPEYTDTYNIGRLNASDQKTVDVVLLSDKQTPPGLIQVPVTIKYMTIDGNPVTQPSSIDLTLDGKAELGIVSVDTNPSPLVEATPFDLTIRIENTGTGDAKQVAATVDLPAEGTKQAFIGKIKPGDDAPALFLIENMKGGTYPYNLTVTYTDDMGVHSFTQPMTLRVPPSDSSGNVILGLIVLAILALIGY
ncbi:COG1361 S-layer family protein, partial [Methanoregula sp.]|uniref:COG1361 S-layer family protein n=1 Tax=Methanoregula sp. TaxID=2052170 RepID=UPI003BB11098